MCTSRTPERRPGIDCSRMRTNLWLFPVIFATSGWPIPQRPGYEANLQHHQARALAALNRTQCACALMTHVLPIGDVEPAGKSVLVSFQANRRVLTPSQSTVSEWDLLLVLCRSKFGSLMPAKPHACMLILQVKDAAWGDLCLLYKNSPIIYKTICGWSGGFSVIVSQCVIACSIKIEIPSFAESWSLYWFQYCRVVQYPIEGERESLSVCFPFPIVLVSVPLPPLSLCVSLPHCQMHVDVVFVQFFPAKLSLLFAF